MIHLKNLHRIYTAQSKRYQKLNEIILLKGRPEKAFTDSPEKTEKRKVSVITEGRSIALRKF